MLSKNEVKYIQSLSRKKQRDQEQLFVAEGVKIANELLHHPQLIQHVYATKQWLEKSTLHQIPFTEISEPELERISSLTSPNEVLVIAKQQHLTHDPEWNNQLTLALDGIQDPGNMGTILRTADWFGISQVVCSTDCADIYNPKVVQSSMGSFLRVRMYNQDFNEWKADPNVPVYGAMLSGENIYTIEKLKEAIIVIGSEGKGIREPLLSQITHPITIPRFGEAESLNAAVAAGIIMSWICR